MDYEKKKQVKHSEHSDRNNGMENMIVRMNTRVFFRIDILREQRHRRRQTVLSWVHGRCEPDALQDITGKRRRNLSRKSRSRLEAEILTEDCNWEGATKTPKETEKE